MPYVVVDLPSLVTATSGMTATNGVGLLDDADSLTIYVTSSATTASTGAGLQIQISQFDPSVPAPTGVTQSTQWFTYGITSTIGGPPVLTTGLAYVINSISFRGIRINGLTSAIASETIARITKQILV